MTQDKPPDDDSGDTGDVDVAAVMFGCLLLGMGLGMGSAAFHEMTAWKYALWNSGPTTLTTGSSIAFNLTIGTALTAYGVTKGGAATEQNGGQTSAA